MKVVPAKMSTQEIRALVAKPRKSYEDKQLLASLRMLKNAKLTAIESELAGDKVTIAETRGFVDDTEETLYPPVDAHDGNDPSLVPTKSLSSVERGRHEDNMSRRRELADRRHAPARTDLLRVAEN